MRPPVALLAIALAAAAAPAARADAPLPAADTSPYFRTTMERVADGVYAWVTPTPRGGIVSGNSLAVVGDDGVLVVDTGHFPSLARRMIADLRAVTTKPVRYVVTTHWHSDHLFGNAAYREAFPGAVFVAHAETRRLVEQKDPAAIDQQRQFPALPERVRALLAAGKHKNGAPLTPDERTQLEDTLPVLETVLGDADVTLVAPTLTFDDALTLWLGRREVRVLHLGRGNTAGDAVVYVPDAKVVATGDLVVSPVPYAYGSYLGEWSAVLRKLATLDATVVVPGHGAVEHDFAYPLRVADLLDAIRVQVAASVKAGLSVEEARAKLDVARFEAEIVAGDPARAFDFRIAVVVPAVERAYQEAKGALEDE